MKVNKFRYRFAFFTTYLEADEYNQLLWEAIDKECIKNSIDLIMYSCRNMKDQKKHQLIFNEIFNFFNPELFDGIILSTSSLINHVGAEEFYDKLNRIINSNLVSLSIDLKNVSSIVIDNEYGMKLMAEHLVEIHNFKKILYISASKEYPEGLIRLNSFRNKLAEYNIVLDEKDIIYGDFTSDSVIPILEPLLDEKPLEWDVIVCANDTMASKSIDILKKHGYSVPGDIAVTGFDNSTLANIQLPNITTIDQSLKNIASEAVLLLLSQIKGGIPAKKIIIKPELIINESCGCYIKNNKTINNKKNRDIDDDRMLEILQNNIFNPKSDSFIREVQKIIYLCTDETSVSSLENYVFTMLKSIEIENQELLWNIIYKLKTLFNDIKNTTRLYEHVAYRDNIVETRIENEKLLTSEDKPNLFKNINILFSDNNINNYYLLLYNEFDNKNELRLVHGVKDGNVINKDEGYSLVDDFIPGKYLPADRSTLISFPLFSMNRFFGFLLIESSRYNNNFYESIQTNIGSALMNILYLIQLKETQKLLIESKKIEFLGNMVAGLAHEINTPVGILLTASSFLKDHIGRLNENFNNGKLTKRKLKSFFSDSNQTYQLIDNNLSNTINLIQRFKMIALNYDISIKSSFNLIDQINNIISNKKDELLIKRIKVIIESHKDFFIESYSVIFDQLFLELFENSLSHGFIDTGGGKIHIKISRQDGFISILYEDNGKNCNKNLLSNIFNPFYTTKRYQGYSGLGLTIVYNLVRINLGGTMECDLSESKGLMFKIVFPE